MAARRPANKKPASRQGASPRRQPAASQSRGLPGWLWGIIGLIAGFALAQYFEKQAPRLPVAAIVPKASTQQSGQQNGQQSGQQTARQGNQQQKEALAVQEAGLQRERTWRGIAGAGLLAVLLFLGSGYWSFRTRRTAAALREQAATDRARVLEAQVFAEAAAAESAGLVEGASVTGLSSASRRRSITPAALAASRRTGRHRRRRASPPGRLRPIRGSFGPRQARPSRGHGDRGSG